jgi:eukaryotic-like serine/threonine-protein kinase
MGEIWRCRDPEQERDVAVKTIRPEFLNERWAVRLFQAEVVAVARLNHPGIVPVYDLATGEDGGAYMVMEFRPGRSLGDLVRPPRPWPVVHAILDQVLDALGYAHARGVLHLDIKPDNVIIARRGSALHATLLDFGVARVRRPGMGIERWLDRDTVLGTMAYMAPEQCSGVVERFGPWTDLYSVGAVAYELCAGHPPFRLQGGQGYLRRLHEAPPRLYPRGEDVPERFVELVGKLLAPSPADRPLCAADVLSELHGMGPGGDQVADAARLADGRRRGGLSASGAATAPAPAEPLPSDVVAIGIEEGMTMRAQLASGDPDGSTVEMRAGRRRAVTTVTGEMIASEPVAADAPLPPLPGAYGLYGLRDLPVLGRLAERRQIWEAVAKTVHDGRPMVVLLEGPAGVGKSRLARDAAERAVELGLCVAMQTSWSSEGSGDEGLKGLIENLLDTRGAPKDRVRARLEFWLERLPGLHASFAREVELLLRPPVQAAPDAGMPLRVAVDTVWRAARLKPVLLWLDDVQWGRGEAAALIDALLERAELPVCVVATVREEEIADAAAYASLAERPGVTRVRMDRLDPGATQQLVRGLIDIDDDLAEALAARAEGNPLFAAQLVRDLVESGALERRGARFRLARAYDLSSVPADIGALWERRLEKSGAGRRELAALALVRERVSMEIALELARLLGAGAEEAIGRALSTGLITVEGGAYAWIHGLLRDHLIQGIPDSDRAALHGTAAVSLAPLVGREDVQEERARHLHAAGRRREACEALLDACLWGHRHADAAAWCTRAEALVLWAREGRFRDLQGRAQAELAYMDAEAGRGPKAETRISKARALHESAWIALRHSQAVRLLGRATEGERASEEALRRAREEGVADVEVLALLQLGLDRSRRGEVEEARRLLGEAADNARRAGNRLGEAQAGWVLASLEEGGEGVARAARAVELAHAEGALRYELFAKKVWVGLLWQTGARSQARAEVRKLIDEAARRSLRQLVSLLSIEGAGWALAEQDWKDAMAQRHLAAQWGASRGANVERAALCAIDIALALAGKQEARAVELLQQLDEVRDGYADDSLRGILRAAAAIASPAIAERLTRI